MSLCNAYFNGDFVPLAQVSISPMDRGFLFGDGAYEAIPVYGRCCFDLPGHLTRLDNTLRALEIDNPHTALEWQSILQTLIDDAPVADNQIYLHVTRGVQSVRQHDFTDCSAPTVFVLCSPLPPVPQQHYEHGISLRTCTEIRWRRRDLKVTSLVGNVLIKREAVAQGAQEALIVESGYVLEGAASNVFALIDGVLHTPATEAGNILPGVTRVWVLSNAAALGCAVCEGNLKLSDLVRATEIWICSSTRGVLPVTRLDDQPVASGVPGPLWQGMHRRYLQFLDSLRSGTQ